MKVITSRILPVNAILLIVGLVDLATTVFWLHTGSIVEANPIMAGVLRSSLGLFIFVKLLTLAAYVGVIEACRKRNARFACAVSNFTLLAYLCIYTISFWCTNRSFFFS